ncbi:MAG: hypothetical protein ACFE0Q_11955 [Anaerolineae bacterium]
MNTLNINSNRFLLHWLVNALSVWLSAGMACFLAWLPFAVLISVLGQFDNLLWLTGTIGTVALLIVPGASIGYVIGDIQRNLIRDFLRWDFSDWQRATMFGGVLGGLAVIGSMLVLRAEISLYWQWMLMMPLFILPISLMQWRILRHHSREAWVWVLGNLVAGIVFSGLFFNPNPFPIELNAVIDNILRWGISASAQGIITGIVMLWLYDHPASDWDDDAELARVYLEIHSHDDR